MLNAPIPDFLSNTRLRGSFTAITVSLLLVVALLLPARLTAQALGSCGTEITPDQVSYQYNKTMALRSLIQKRAAYSYKIPIQNHIVRQSSGTGGFTQADIDSVMSQANVLFGQVNVSIYEYNPVDYIDENFFYFDCSTATQWDSLRNYNVEPNAINIYWVPNGSNFPYCGLSSFPGSGVQGIVMNDACGGVGTSNSTAVHEIGHYFDLFHTHETAFGVECPSESNCSTAGDLICDTPADPNLNGEVSSYPTCQYLGSAPPPSGCDATPYNPQTDNIMSYSTKSCRDLFTPEQIDKFRLSLENDRPELAIQVGNLFYRPTSIGALEVPVGNVTDTTVTLENVGTSPISVTSVSTLNGIISVTGPSSITLNPGQTQDYILGFDASALTAPCDLGTYNDVVTFNTTDADRPVYDMPIAAVVGLGTPAVEGYSFGPNCLKLGLGNTPEFNALTDPISDVLYDASLIVGLVDGSDTTVYQGIYGSSEYSVIDGFTQGTDGVGRTTQTLHFLTADSRIYGTLKYSYGANTASLDSCAIIQVEYTITNDCDTSLTIVPGIFGDFDIDDSGNNDATVNSSLDLVYVGYSAGNHYAGFTNLTPDETTRGGAAISNSVVIYPTGQLQDNEAYQLLTGGYTGNVTATDVSALLSFGKRSLPAGGQTSFAGAIVISTVSPSDLESKAADIRNFYSPPTYVCGDADGSGSITIGDAVFLINYIFGGGPAPNPLVSGDSDCSGSISISDAVYLINFIFGGGPAPCASCP